MTYVGTADFRQATLKAWTLGIPLSTDETNGGVSDPNLTELISQMSRRFDRYTHDHYEPLTGSAIVVVADPATDTFTAAAHGLSDGWIVWVGGTTPPAGLTASTDYYVVSSTANTFKLAATSGGTAINFTSAGTAVTVTSRTTQVLVAGTGMDRVYLPMRARSIQEVALSDGTTFAAQDVDNYSFISSLDSDASSRSVEAEWDTLLLVGASSLVFAGWGSGTLAWPEGAQNIRVSGEFGWGTTPDDVKRAVALMCWETVRPIGDYLRYGDEVQVDGATINPAGDCGISRIRDVCSIAEDYRRTVYL